MLGFGPISGNGMVPGGSGEWFSPFGASSSAFPEKWYLARLVGERSSAGGFAGRPLYRAEVCRSSNSSSSTSAAKITNVGRLVHGNFGGLPGVPGRPRYKVDASYGWSAGATFPVPPPAGSERTWGRLVGSRSSFLSNSSLISGRNLYAAKPHCKGNAPKSLSSSSWPSSNSNFSWSSGLSFGCCPDRTVWPNRLKVRFVRTAGTCTAYDVWDGMHLLIGQNAYLGYLNGCNPGGYYWHGSASGGLVEVPFLICQSANVPGVVCRFTFFAGGQFAGQGPNSCNFYGGGFQGIVWNAWYPAFDPTSVCNGVFPLTGSITITQGIGFGVDPYCCTPGETNTWQVTIDVEPEP